MNQQAEGLPIERILHEPYRHCTVCRYKSTKFKLPVFWALGDTINLDIFSHFRLSIGRPQEPNSTPITRPKQDNITVQGALRSTHP